MNETEIYLNRARHDGRIQDITDCEDSLEELVFAMRDQSHEFSLGLTTILRCLAIAEKEGYVPELPSEWWCRLRTP